MNLRRLVAGLAVAIAPILSGQPGSADGRPRSADGQPRSRRSADGFPAEARVPGLDDLVDQPQAFVEREERALHRVQGQPLHLAEADPERGIEPSRVTVEVDPPRVGWREPVRVSVRSNERIDLPFAFSTTIVLSATAVARGELDR